MGNLITFQERFQIVLPIRCGVGQVRGFTGAGAWSFLRMGCFGELREGGDPVLAQNRLSVYNVSTFQGTNIYLFFFFYFRSS